MKAQITGGTTETLERLARIDRLMQGAVDLHIHSGPSLMPRKIDHVQAVQQADAAGMAAILLKDHYYPTMPIAHLMNAHHARKVKVLSAIVLNAPLGGLNPSAVDYALRQGASIVWMPTAHALNHIEHDRKDAEFKNKFPTNTKKTREVEGMTLVDETGTVRDAVKEILDMIAEADATVSAGHHHIREAFPFYEEARRRGVRRLFLNHPTYVNEGTMADIRSLVSMGVKMEHSICMFVPCGFQQMDTDHLRAVIEAGGVGNTFFGSDLGQNGNPTPVEGFRQIIAMLLDLGYGEDDVRAMVSTNAKSLMGLE
ncbi:DUF6282 family protein [Roseomonas sp. E05]|uniref:DUF6282 family protein n=1 Tax=Roseomonas sp. E05 TaxID=3046310 RepID=UPI0024BBDE67|nr:DUF6282 family protein [Roseomonas sp. E05]MDJ0389556.1 DUF6282 family protein [Roseomonas sp. E05]